MRDPNRKCPHCGAVITKNEDGFCPKCHETLDDQHQEKPVVDGW